jgi:hypothetical protein
VALEETLPDPEVTFEAARRARKDELRLDVELVTKLSSPLLGEVRRRENGQTTRFATIYELARDERGLDRLADTDVVRDQKANWIW